MLFAALTLQDILNKSSQLCTLFLAMQVPFIIIIAIIAGRVPSSCLNPFDVSAHLSHSEFIFWRELVR